ncbi:MAG: histidine utilization repressor [Alphaproteobacteria bacterium]|nr:MAG: histidine utilization repressor [Alphaproteobacteria bacterium]
MNIVPETEGGKGEPLYSRIKREIRQKIDAGDWRAGDQIPTEHALVEEFNTSRMTVNRALRELTQEGVLARRQGSGTFVAPGKLETGLLEIRNIADDIAEKGATHRAEILLLEREKTPTELKSVLGLSQKEVFHCLILHWGNEVPVQLEDRYVNPVLVPDFLKQAFIDETPSGFLIRTQPYSRAEHHVSADRPTEEQKRLLKLEAGEPVLTLARQTFAGSKLITSVRLHHPGGRFTFGGTFTADR